MVLKQQIPMHCRLFLAYGGVSCGFGYIWNRILNLILLAESRNLGLDFEPCKRTMLNLIDFTLMFVSVIRAITVTETASRTGLVQINARITTIEGSLEKM